MPTLDLIVCNPPSVFDLEIFDTLPDTLYEPLSGLLILDHDDPMVFYKALAAFAQKNLWPKGIIYVQVRKKLEDAFRTLFEAYDFVWVHTYKQRLLEEDLIISTYYKEPGHRCSS